MDLMAIREVTLGQFHFVGHAHVFRHFYPETQAVFSFRNGFVTNPGGIAKVACASTFALENVFSTTQVVIVLM